MHVRTGVLAGGLALWLLAGCSLILDPDDCTSASDCENGQTCSSGICLGAITPPTPEEDLGAEAGPDMGGAVPDVGELPPDTGPVVDMTVDPPDMPDATPPEPMRPICEILEPDTPEIGPLAAETVTIRGVVNDPDTPIESLTVTLAGAPLTLMADGTFSLDLALDEGRNVVVLEAMDPEMLGCSDEVVVRIDRTAPSLDITDPNGDIVVNPARNPYRVGGVVEDEGGIAAIEVTVNGEPVDGPAPAAGDFGFPVVLAEGVNTIEVVSEDAAGNRSAPVRREIALDSEPPEVSIDSPADGTRQAGDSVRVQGAVRTRGVGERRSNIRARVNGQAVELDAAERAANDEGEFDLEVGLAIGDNLIRIEGDDQAGNFGNAEIVVIREDPAPCVDIESPEADTFVGRSLVTLGGTVCPAVVAVEVSVDGGDAVAGIIAEGRFTAEIEVAPGPRTLQVRATTADDQAASDRVQIVYDDSPPTVRIDSPAPGTCTNAETIQVCGQADDPESGVTAVVVNQVPAEELFGPDFCVGLDLLPGADVPIRARVTNGAGRQTTFPALGQPDYAVNVDRTAPAIIVEVGGGVPWLRPDGAGNIVLRGSFDGGVCGPISATVQRLCDADEPVDPACLPGESVVGIQNDNTFTFRRAFPDGRQRGVLISVTDTAGNSDDRSVVFRVDSLPPAILDQTADGFTVEPQIEICVLLEDTASGVGEVLIGEEQADVQPLGQNHEACLIVLLDEGPNEIVISASDTVGNQVTGQVNITRDATPPDVAITWPPPGGGVPVPTIVEGTIDDGPDGSGALSVTVNGIAAQVDAESGTWRAARVAIDPDDPVVRVEARDRVQNAIIPFQQAVSVPAYVDLGADRGGFDTARAVSWLGITDADMDGLQDIIALTDDANGASAIYTMARDFTFEGSAAGNAGLPEVAVTAAAMGDVDADGTVDLVLSGQGATGAYLGDGDGGFAVANSGIPANILANGLVLGDINADGTLDLILFAGAATRVQTNNAGSFNTQPLGEFGLGAIVDADHGALVDVNADAVLDLVTVGRAGSRLLLGALGGAFAADANFASAPAQRIVPLDANRTGQMDVFTADELTARFYTARVGGYDMGLLGVLWAPGDVGLVAADLDGDTRDDVVVYGATGLRLYRGTVGGFEAVDTEALGWPALIGVRHAQIVDFEADGDLDLAYATADRVGVIYSNAAVLEERLYSRVRIERGLEGDAGPADAVGVVLAHEYAPGMRRLIPALPAAPTIVSRSGDDIEIQVRFPEKGDAGGSSRNLPALVANPATVNGPE